MTETSTGASVPVTDEMVETAARAIWNHSAREIDGCPLWDGRLPSNIRYSIRSNARAALEAAAPLIAAAALQPIRDALASHPRCEEHPDGDVISCGWKAAVLDVQRALEARDE